MGERLFLARLGNYTVANQAPDWKAMSNLEKLRFLLSIATADGAITSEELRFFSHRALEWGITDDEFEQVLDEAGSDHPPALQIPDDIQLRADLLKEMILMMAADGQLHQTERSMFASVAAKMEIDEIALNSIIDEVIAENS